MEVEFSAHAAGVTSIFWAFCFSHLQVLAGFFCLHTDGACHEPHFSSFLAVESCFAVVKVSSCSQIATAESVIAMGAILLSASVDGKSVQPGSIHGIFYFGLSYALVRSECS
jgi:hypothetical protein